jgi:hypothetical protein
MSCNYFSQISIPEKKALDRNTPMACLRSMGLLEPVPVDCCNPVNQLDDLLRKRGLGDTSADVWAAVGGVDTTYMCEPIVLRAGGEVDGPSDVFDLERSPIVYCRTTCDRTKKTVMAAFALDRTSKTADLCVYDPLGDATEENMYQMVGTLGVWLREMLGDGWGLRMEVYHKRYAPTEIAGIEGMPAFWLFIVSLLKVYLPHVRMVDTQAALRVECLSGGTTIKDVVLTVLHNVHCIAFPQS